MLRSPIKINELISRAKEYNYDALAMTDLNNMHGALKFYSKCLENDIKPIIGLQISLTSNMNFYNSILVYAKSEAGYKNLLVLASRAKTVGLVELEFLSKHTYDVLAIIPSDENEIVKIYKEKNHEKAKSLLNEYKNIFDNYHQSLI